MFMFSSQQHAIQSVALLCAANGRGVQASTQAPPLHYRQETSLQIISDECNLTRQPWSLSACFETYIMLVH